MKKKLLLEKVLLGLVLLVAVLAAASPAPSVTDGSPPPECVPGQICQ